MHQVLIWRQFFTQQVSYHWRHICCRRSAAQTSAVETMALAAHGSTASERRLRSWHHELPPCTAVAPHLHISSSAHS